MPAESSYSSPCRSIRTIHATLCMPVSRKLSTSFSPKPWRPCARETSYANRTGLCSGRTSNPTCHNFERKNFRNQGIFMSVSVITVKHCSNFEREKISTGTNFYVFFNMAYFQEKTELFGFISTCTSSFIPVTVFLFSVGNKCMPNYSLFADWISFGILHEGHWEIIATPLPERKRKIYPSTWGSICLRQWRLWGLDPSFNRFNQHQKKGK